MSAEAMPIPTFRAALAQQRKKWAARLAFGENAVISAALAAMVILPLAEALLRRTLHVSIPASIDRKSTRLNSSHTVISYAVFCLKKKKNINNRTKRNSLIT